MSFTPLYLHFVQQIKVKVSQLTNQRVFGRPPSSTDYIFFAFLSQCVGRSTREAAIFLIITLQAVTEPTGLVNLWDSHSSTISSTCFSLQGDFYSTALKTLISVSTLVLLGLVIAYHSLEVQVITQLTNLTHAIGTLSSISCQMKKCYWNFTCQFYFPHDSHTNRNFVPNFGM